MTTSPINAGLPTSAEAAASARQAPSQDLGQEEFLSLLMAQLSNQDPLNPMESTQFMEQVASMNTVQQLVSANQRLDSLMLGLTSLNNQSAVDLVGHNVVAQGKTLQHADGASHDLIYALDAPAEDVSVTVKNEAGDIVQTYELTDVGVGEQTLAWNGRNEENSPVPPGDYTFEVHAVDTEGNEVPAQTYIAGVVSELRFDTGIPVLWIAGQEVTLDQILRITSDELGPTPVGELASDEESAEAPTIDTSNSTFTYPPTPSAN